MAVYEVFAYPHTVPGSQGLVEELKLLSRNVLQTTSYLSNAPVQSVSRVPSRLVMDPNEISRVVTPDSDCLRNLWLDKEETIHEVCDFVILKRPLRPAATRLTDNTYVLVAFDNTTLECPREAHTIGI